jgi:hypothetical protein
MNTDGEQKISFDFLETTRRGAKSERKLDI